MLDTEGEVMLISVFDSFTKIVSKDCRPHRCYLENSIPRNKKELFFNLKLYFVVEREFYMI